MPVILSYWNRISANKCNTSTIFRYNASISLISFNDFTFKSRLMVVLVRIVVPLSRKAQCQAGHFLSMLTGLY